MNPLCRTLYASIDHVLSVLTVRIEDAHDEDKATLRSLYLIVERLVSGLSKFLFKTNLNRDVLDIVGIGHKRHNDFPCGRATERLP